MQMCPDCNKVYDSAEYSKCSYCSGELEDENKKNILKDVLTAMERCIGMKFGNVLIVGMKSQLAKMIMMVLSNVNYKLNF